MKKNNAKLIKIILGAVFYMCVTPAFAAENSWVGIIAPANESKTSEEAKPKQNSLPKNTYSFIAPSKEEKQQQNQTTQTENVGATKPDTETGSQFYKSYDSYQSYYDEKEKTTTERSAIFTNNEEDSTTQYLEEMINNGEALVSSSDVVPVSTQEYNALSQVNLKGESGYPVTASLKANVIELIDKVKSNKLSEAEKRDEVTKEIKSLENMSRALKYKKILAGDINKKMGLPENYIIQMQEDNQDSIQLIDEALEKLRKY